MLGRGQGKVGGRLPKPRRKRDEEQGVLAGEERIMCDLEKDVEEFKKRKEEMRWRYQQGEGDRECRCPYYPLLTRLSSSFSRCLSRCLSSRLVDL